MDENYEQHDIKKAFAERENNICNLTHDRTLPGVASTTERKVMMHIREVENNGFVLELYNTPFGENRTYAFERIPTLISKIREILSETKK